MKRLVNRHALLFLVICALLWGCAARRAANDQVPVGAPAPPDNGKVEVGKPFFDFTAPSIRGGEVRLSDLVGPNVVLLQVWGIRCAPCLAEMTFLSSLHESYVGRGLHVVSVNTDRTDAEQLSQALSGRGLDLPYPILLDPDFAVAKRYTQWLIPVTVLIDRAGVVRSVHTGYKPELNSVIEAEVAELLGG